MTPGYRLVRALARTGLGSRRGCDLADLREDLWTLYPYAQQLLFHAHGDRSLRACRFSSDIDDVGPLIEKAHSFFDRRFGTLEAPSVAEAVWRDVQNADHERTLQ